MLKIIAVVVTYNRKELLLENIAGTLNQTYPIYRFIIVDNNSTDGTEEILAEHGYLNDSRIYYLKLNENIGGAGGFYTGTKKAYELGADAIWLMDDDGRPANSLTLEKLIEHIPDTEFYFLNSLVVCSDKELSFQLHGTDSIQELEQFVVEGIIQNQAAPFNGTLVSAALVRRIGYPNKDFFIKGDENDYKSRARHVDGCHLATVYDSKYRHPQLKVRKRKFLGKEVPISVETPWKEYYRARNYTYMYKKEKMYKAIIYEILLLKLYSIFLIGESSRIKTVRYVIRGINDGLHSRLGKSVLPK